MAIVHYVLERKLGSDSEGTCLALDEEVGAKLVEAGLARLATEEDLVDGGEDEVVEDEEDEADTAEATLAMSSEATATKAEKVMSQAVEKAVRKINQKSWDNLPQHRHVQGSDFEKTGGFTSLGDAAKCFLARSKGDLTAVKKWDRSVKANKGYMSISGDSGHQGGDAVPKQWAEDLWRLSFKDVPDLLGMMRRYDMRYQVENIPAYVQPSAATSITGNVIAEGQAITATIGVTSNVQLIMTKGTVLVNVTDELQRFSPYHIDAQIESIAPERIRFLTNGGVVNGGNNQVNLVGNAATIAYPRATAGQINFNDVTNMYSRLHDPYVNGAAWFISQGSYPALMQMAFPNRSATTPIPIFVPGGFGNSAEGAPLGKLLGLDVHRLENVPSLGSKGDLILANMGSLASGSSGIIADRTPYLYFNLAQDTLRVLFYYASANPLTTPYLRADGTTASNIVVLDVPSS